MLKFKLPLIFTTCLFLVNSCGFHLHGTQGNYKFPFSPVYLDCNNIAICVNLKTTITHEHLAQITNTTESNTVTIKIFDEETRRDPQSFNSAGRVASYLLTYSATAQLWQQHEQISGDIQLNTQATLQYNDSTILSNNQQETEMWQQLQQSATNQLIRRIVYFKPEIATTQHKAE